MSRGVLTHSVKETRQQKEQGVYKILKKEVQ